MRRTSTARIGAGSPIDEWIEANLNCGCRMHLLTESPIALTLLNLLRRSPDTFWTAAAAATAVGITAETAAQALELLDRAGMVERARASNAFRYAGPAEP